MSYLPECGCHSCIEERDKDTPFFQRRHRMITCPVCYNKRCPKATDHELECTGSNNPGQKGSVYE